MCSQVGMIHRTHLVYGWYLEHICIQNYNTKGHSSILFYFTVQLAVVHRFFLQVFPTHCYQLKYHILPQHNSWIFQTTLWWSLHASEISFWLLGGPVIKTLSVLSTNTSQLLARLQEFEGLQQIVSTPNAEVSKRHILYHLTFIQFAWYSRNVSSWAQD